jgi:hypothetical protein
LLISVCRQQWEISTSHCCLLPFTVYCWLTYGISRTRVLASRTLYYVGIAPLSSNRVQECKRPVHVMRWRDDIFFVIRDTCQIRFPSASLRPSSSTCAPHKVRRLSIFPHFVCFSSGIAFVVVAMSSRIVQRFSARQLQPLLRSTL